MAEILEHYLQGEDGAGRILAHARTLSRIAMLYGEMVASHLLAASRLANLKSGIVVLHANSNAVAAKLRQLTPTLMEKLRQNGIACRDVQIKVRSNPCPAPVKTATVKPLSPRAREQLATLRESLPCSPLREAIETLLARAASRPE